LIKKKCCGKLKGQHEDLDECSVPQRKGVEAGKMCVNNAVEQMILGYVNEMMPGRVFYYLRLISLPTIGHVPVAMSYLSISHTLTQSRQVWNEFLSQPSLSTTSRVTAENFFS
jgi:hypothetical protein